jgi:hypothetical protein
MKRMSGHWLQSRLLSLAALAGGLAASTSGCGVLGAKPWDHDLLSQRAMQVNPYPLEAAVDDHIYFSKEASSGGRTFAGGGCGCN